MKIQLLCWALSHTLCAGGSAFHTSENPLPLCLLSMFRSQRSNMFFPVKMRMYLIGKVKFFSKLFMRILMFLII